MLQPEVRPYRLRKQARAAKAAAILALVGERHDPVKCYQWVRWAMDCVTCTVCGSTKPPKRAEPADLCPECGHGTLVFEEGCQKCYSCGYSEC